MNLITIKIDEIYETTITSLENEGSGVGKVKGITVFVSGALVGETVRVRITQVKKNYARAKLIEIISPSITREKSECPYYGKCGGCNLRHQTEKENLNFKKAKIVTALKRIGKIDAEVQDVIPSLKVNNYRNKATFKVEKNKIGFYEENSYRLIDIDNCKLLEENINQCLIHIRNYIKSNDNQVKMITIKYSNAFGNLLVDVFSADEKDERIIKYLIDMDKNVKTIIFNDQVRYGDGYINQITNSLMFKCSAKSFFQINTVQTEKLYDTVMSVANLQRDDVVLDLYCGTGTLTNIIAKKVKRVIGIEIIQDAVFDAKENAKVNSINNVKFLCGNVLNEIKHINAKVNAIFIDPPRKGVEKSTLEVVLKIFPKKIIY
ncbi:MAG: 23S rRNA (uracil(1939)-C(5))-methyltransferase RlmD, partial [Bacilli bacterium]